MSLRRTLVFFVVLGLLAATPPASLAQERDPPAAEALFLRGRAAMEAGNLAEACASFAESYRLDAAVGTLLNQARCEEMSGLLADSWEHYQAAVEKLPPGDERLPLARERASGLNARVPRLTIRLERGAPAGSKVYRDQIELRGASLGVALPLNPGEHRVEVRAPGRESREIRVAVREGQRVEVEAQVGPPLAASSARAATSPPPLRPSTARTVGWAAGSVGAVAVLASLGLGAWALERRQVVRSRCPANQCDAEGLRAGGELDTLTRVSSGALLVGLLGLGSGAYLVATTRF